MVNTVQWTGVVKVTSKFLPPVYKRSYFAVDISYKFYANVWQTWVLICKIRGAFKKFCNSIWCTNDTSKIFMLLFNIITLNTNAYVTFIKQLFDASQIEFLLHALQVWLGGLLDLIIIFEPCSCSTGCSKGRSIGIAVTPTLLNRPTTQCLRSISSSEEVVPRWQWDQACRHSAESYLNSRPS